MTESMDYTTYTGWMKESNRLLNEFQSLSNNGDSKNSDEDQQEVGILDKRSSQAGRSEAYKIAFGGM